MVIITFQDYDFLKNHIFSEYAGGLVKVTSPLPLKLQFFYKNHITKTYVKSFN